MREKGACNGRGWGVGRDIRETGVHVGEDKTKQNQRG